MAIRLCFLTLLSYVLIAHHPTLTYGQFPIGVCYGTQGDNLPPAADVVAKYKSIGIERMRLFEPLPDVLDALQGTGIELILGVRNEDLEAMANDFSAAAQWVAKYVTPYFPAVNIKYISVGNEIVPAAGLNVVGALVNMNLAIQGAGFTTIKVSTVVSLETLGVSYPPSQATFSDASTPIMQRIGQFLAENRFPLMINIYPYFAYAANPDKIDVNYAICNPYIPPQVEDAGLSYKCMADAMVDAFYYAMEKLNCPDVDAVISEIGWPSAGNGNFTTYKLAAQANLNMMLHVVFLQGTPKRHDKKLETYFFAFFNENLKPAGVEQNFGLFNPDMNPVYPLF